MLTVQVKYASGAELVIEAKEVFVESCNTALTFVQHDGVSDEISLCSGDYAEVKNGNGIIVRTIGE